MNKLEVKFKVDHIKNGKALPEMTILVQHPLACGGCTRALRTKIEVSLYKKIIFWIKWVLR